MREVNIYTYSAIKGMRKADGTGIYVLECKLEGADGKQKQATVHGLSVYEHVTANESHLRLLAEALGRLKEKCKITIYTDNAYVAGAFKNEWILNWERNEWKGSKGKEIEHKELWKEIKEKTKGMEIEVKWGKHHEFKDWMKNECERRKNNV